MLRSLLSIALASSLLTLSACGGGGGGEGGGDSPAKSNASSTDVLNGVAVKQTNLTASSECPNGGISIETGIDKNGNGILDADEVQKVQKLCNPTVTLVDFEVVEPGSVCQLGGTRIMIGTDSNNSGVLDSAEVQTTHTLCQGSQPNGGSTFALSDKGTISGQLDVTRSQVQTLSALSISAQEVTSKEGSLWLTPSDVLSAIQADQDAAASAANNPGSATQVTPPVIEPVEVTVNADGSYSADVPAGTDYSLNYVSEDGTQGIKLDDINVSPGQSTNVDIADQDLTQVGSLSIEIQDLSTGSAIDGATLTLLNDGSSAATNAEGKASFAQLAAGEYLLLAEKAGYISQTFSRKINPGAQVDGGVFQLNAEKGSASGTVAVSTNLLTSQANLVVYARDSRGGIYTTLTDAAGTFRFPALPVGEGYTFIAQANDFAANKVDSQTITAATNTDIGTITLSPETLKQGSITGYARFSEKLGISNAHAGILVAVEGTDKEAVTSRDGAFVLTGLNPGRYTLNITDSNYQTQTLTNVRVVATSATNLDPIELDLKSGEVTGIVSLEGISNASGVLVELMGTDHKAYTDVNGRWAMELPTGNYGNGIRYSRNLFEETTSSETITITENGYFQVAPQSLSQTGKQISLDLSSTAGQCNGLQVRLQGIAGDASGYTATLPILDGTLNQELVFGTYTLTASCTASGFETVVRDIVVSPNGSLNLVLEAIELRISFASINNDAQYTNNADVNLEIGAQGAAEMQVISGTFDSGWIAFAADYALTLGSGDGDNTVTVNLRDSNAQPLSAVSDSIVLDTRIDLSEFTLTGATTKGDTLHIKANLAETDADVNVSVSGLVNSLKLFDNGTNGDAVAGDGVYERDLTIDTSHEFDTAAEITITDRAGNTLMENSAANLVLSTAPGISSVSVSSNVAAGEMTISFSTDEPTTTQINYGTDRAALSTNLPISALATQNHQVTLTGLPAGELTYFRLTATDASNNNGTFEGEGKLAPAPIEKVTIAPGNGEIGLAWKESDSPEISGYNIYRSADNGQSYAQVNTSMITEQYFVDTLSNGTYFYYITALDGDGNESLPSTSVSATASSDLAGPTVLDASSNGLNVVAEDTLWLASRSPYELRENVLIRKEAKLQLLPGTKVDFIGTGKSLVIRGRFTATGTAEKKVIINGEQDNIVNPNTDLSSFLVSNESVQNSATHTIWNHTKLLTEGVEDFSDTGRSFGVDSQLLITSFYFENVDMLMRSSSNAFWLESLNSSNVVFENCNEHSSHGFQVAQISNSHFSNSNSATDCISQKEVASSIRDFTGTSASWSRVKYSTVSDSVITNIHFTSAEISNRIIDSRFVNSTIGNFGREDITIISSILENSQVVMRKLQANTVNISKTSLDLNSSVAADILNAAKNYWGTTDIDNIFTRVTYSPNPDEGTHLYPIISSPDINNADFDSDGLPDIIDPDSDNDGYSDLQEDYSSNPEFGSVYNPLNINSKPSTSPDNDFDGIPDSTDGDDDNDGLNDIEEVSYGTNPYSSDTDGDGSNDKLELDYNYDPADASKFLLPEIITNLTIDRTFENKDGVIVIYHPNATIRNSTVSSGSVIQVDRGSSLTIFDSNFSGTANNPIVIRDTAVGNGFIDFSGSTLSYVNVKTSKELRFNFSTVVNSDLFSANMLFQRDNSRFSKSALFGNVQLAGKVNNSLVSNLTGSSVFIFGQMTDTSVTPPANAAAYAGNLARISRSIIPTLQYEGALIEDSIIGLYYYCAKSGAIQNSDVYFPGQGGPCAIKLDGSYITGGNSNIPYTGLGIPADTVGDGVASTAFTVGGVTAIIDGISNPRSTPNFPNGESDLWNPNGVGALWDKDDPNTFPDPLGL